MRIALACSLVLFPFLISAAEQPSLPVSLTVAEPAGLNRPAGEAVTTGVPFAPGALRWGAPLALTDAGGNGVPLQVRPLVRWADGSVRWALLDFQLPADLAANAKTEFTLAAGEPKVAAKPLQVEAGADTVVVTTGPLRASISTKVFSLFTSVTVDGKDALSAKDAPALQIADATGKVRDSVADLAPGYEVKVTESGPLRAVVRATGEMQATAKDRLGFTCWYHFYAGSKSVRLFVTLRNLSGKAFTQTDQASVQDMAYQRMVAREAGNVSVKSVDLLVRVAASAKPAYVLAGDKPLSGTLDAGSVKLYQDSSAGWTWQVGDGRIVDQRINENKKFMATQGKPNLPYYEYEPDFYKALTDKQNYVGCTFRGYRVYDAAGKQTGEGDRSPGWAQLDTTTVAVRWFWQMYPKSIELAADGAVRVGLWPKEWSNPHVFEGHIHKTHEIQLSFGDTAGAAAAEATYRRFDRRLLAVAPNTYLCATGAFNGYLMPEDRKDFPRFEDWALSAIKSGVNPNINICWSSSMEIEREKYDKYGVWNFGDTSKRGWRGYGQYLELDIPYCLAAHFARTTNRGFFDELEIHARQLMDVPAHGGGYGHQAGESSHYYTTGALLYYYLTGLQFVRESVKASHDAFAKVAPWHARSFGITMWSNLDCYREYGDEDTTLGQPWHFGSPPLKKANYLANIQNDLKWFLAAQDAATGFRPYGQFNFQEFMLGIMMDSLGRYCTEFPEQREWRDRLVALANATIESLPDKGYKAEWMTVCNCNGLTYAYMFTGRDRFLDAAMKLIDKEIASDDKTFPHYRTGTGSGKSYSEHGHRLTQTCMWARWYRGVNGTPKPPDAITDLTAKVVAGGEVQVSWTAPANAKDGATYFVKISDKPFKDDLKTTAEGKTATNWWTAPIAATLTPPEPQATAMHATLAPPPKATTVYVAVRTAKQVGPITAVSDLSNVVKLDLK